MTGRISRYIDHTLLKPDATSSDIERLCEEAREYGFFAVCINGSWVRTARALLQGSPVKVVSVAGFPLGAMSSEAKQLETEMAVRDGAQEVDFVLNVGRLKQGDRKYLLDEIRGVSKACAGCPVKVIIETCLLTREEKIEACLLSVEGGAQFVKTSTGFGIRGATTEDVKLMREIVGPAFGVKASGGIRDMKTAVEMIEAGATRLGTSAGIAIVKGEQ